MRSEGEISYGRVAYRHCHDNFAARYGSRLSFALAVATAGFTHRVGLRRVDRRGCWRATEILSDAAAAATGSAGHRRSGRDRVLTVSPSPADLVARHR